MSNTWFYEQGNIFEFFSPTLGLDSDRCPERNTTPGCNFCQMQPNFHAKYPDRNNSWWNSWCRVWYQSPMGLWWQNSPTASLILHRNYLAIVIWVFSAEKSWFLWQKNLLFMLLTWSGTRTRFLSCPCMLSAKASVLVSGITCFVSSDHTKWFQSSSRTIPKFSRVRSLTWRWTVKISFARLSMMAQRTVPKAMVQSWAWIVVCLGFLLNFCHIYGSLIWTGTAFLFVFTVVSVCTQEWTYCIQSNTASGASRCVWKQTEKHTPAARKPTQTSQTSNLI